MTEELKPCPFCGGNAKVFETTDSCGRNPSYMVECLKCDAGTGYHDGDEKAAVDAWNKRNYFNAVFEDIDKFYKDENDCGNCKHEPDDWRLMSPQATWYEGTCQYPFPKCIRINRTIQKCPDSKFGFYQKDGNEITDCPGWEEK